MSILNDIKAEQKQARLNRDKFRAGILTTLMAEVSIVGKNAGRETTDEEAEQVVGKFLKGANENLDLLVKAKVIGDKLVHIGAEIEIYKEFLPQQLDEEELTREIGIFLGDNAGANIGQIMGFLKGKFKGQYDGKLASQIIRGMIQ